MMLTWSSNGSKEEEQLTWVIMKYILNMVTLGSVKYSCEYVKWDTDLKYIRVSIRATDYVIKLLRDNMKMVK